MYMHISDKRTRFLPESVDREERSSAGIYFTNDSHSSVYYIKLSVARLVVHFSNFDIMIIKCHNWKYCLQLKFSVMMHRI